MIYIDIIYLSIYLSIHRHVFVTTNTIIVDSHLPEYRIQHDPPMSTGYKDTEDRIGAESTVRLKMSLRGPYEWDMGGISEDA